MRCRRLLLNHTLECSGGDQFSMMDGTSPSMTSLRSSLAEAAARSNPHRAAHRPPVARGFLPRRLSDAGHTARGQVATPRHPKPFTTADPPVSKPELQEARRSGCSSRSYCSKAHPTIPTEAAFERGEAEKRNLIGCPRRGGSRPLAGSVTPRPVLPSGEY
jgi:hypothetical protein